MSCDGIYAFVQGTTKRKRLASRYELVSVKGSGILSVKLRAGNGKKTSQKLICLFVRKLFKVLIYNLSIHPS